MGNLIQTGNSLSTDVGAIVDQILSLPKVPSTLKFYNEGTVKYLDASVYIKALYHALDNTKNYPSLCAVIFSMKNVPEFCGANINFYEDLRVRFNTDPTSSINGNLKFADSVYNLALKVLKKECPIGYISLGLYIDKPSRWSSGPRGHNNNLILCKNNSTLDIYLFDPHGQNRKSIWNYRANVFIRYLIDILRKKGIKAERKIIYNGCQTRGLQRKQTDPGGYCVLISLFWFYCLLILSKNYDVEYLITNLESVLLEKDVEKRNQGGLMETYVKFAAYLVNKTIEKLKGLDNYENFKKLFVGFALKISEKVENRKGVKYAVKDLEEDTFLDEGEEVLESTENSEEKKDVRPNLPDVLTFKGVDGSRCIKNTDCFSHNCVKNICKPYHPYDSDSDTDFIDEEYIKRIRAKREEYKREKSLNKKIETKERMRKLREEENFLTEKLALKRLKSENPELYKQKKEEEILKKERPEEYERRERLRENLFLNL